MKCPFCHTPDTKVVDSRLTDVNEVRRRRVCIECDERFTTYETVDLVMPRVVKKDQSREAFDQNKLRQGMLRALEKRPVSTDQIDEAIMQILHKIRSTGEKEVNVSRVGDLIMEALSELDEVAYIRFASVYRRFKSLEEFQQAIDKLSSN